MASMHPAERRHAFEQYAAQAEEVGRVILWPYYRALVDEGFESEDALYLTGLLQSELLTSAGATQPPPFGFGHDFDL